MPQYKQHRAQAEHNKKLLSHLTEQGKQSEYGDWYITVAFYAALHYFEAVISVKPVNELSHSRNHAVRNRVMLTTFGALYRPYAVLYRLSRSARYDCHAPDKHDWRQAENLLNEVKKECDVLVSGRK